MKQLWLVAWWESNLNFKRYYSDEYFRSLNGIFNGTLSYRNDSIILNNHYGGGYQWKPIAVSDIKEDEWKAYENRAVDKPKYEMLIY